MFQQVYLKTHKYHILYWLYCGKVKKFSMAHLQTKNKLLTYTHILTIKCEKSRKN